MSYNEAKEKYAALGVDTEAAIERLKTVPVWHWKSMIRLWVLLAMVRWVCVFRLTLISMGLLIRNGKR